MILLESLKTNFSLTDKGFLLHLCNRLYARHAQPNNYYSASGESSALTPNSHKCEMLYMVSTKGFQ